ncbi:MAG: type I-B CRISPR-associated protein Cas5 [Salinivirgaceae bacterium]|nr:type I-B CRISPR-associated protein Cas5 [Salinivirgaceae bacterium]
MASNQKLISFALKAEMGFFKKPDINSGIYLTYNMLHKPALLGILGAIAGLQGYQENGKFPEYYQILKHLKVGIKPLDSDNGNFTKDIVAYNNGTGFASSEPGGNLIVTEQIIIKPAYRCYLLLNTNDDVEKILYERIRDCKAEFLPYMGKNDFSAWWENVTEYDAEKFSFESNYKIASIFAKTEAVGGYVAKSMSMFSKESKEATFMYFEKLPVSFDEKLYQYEYKDFVYSNATFLKDMNMSDAGDFYKINTGEIIQLF